MAQKDSSQKTEKNPKTPNILFFPPSSKNFLVSTYFSVGVYKL